MSDVEDPSDSGPLPDYELAPEVRADTTTQLKAMAHPIRIGILHMVVERAATTSELARAVGRSHGTVAHHLKVLEEAGLVRVVRTRQVRGITESFWGRTGRTIMVDPPPGEEQDDAFIHEALRTFVPGDVDYTTLRFARITAEQAEAFTERLQALIDEFLQQPRSGSTT
jgi:DNA-binding transcriptional ArsR family regulator